MADTILDRTRNFLHLYLHHAGESEVPRAFHTWCAFSLIAACVGDQVGLAKTREKLLYPNLYTMLLGPSALGKGEAIDTATKFINKVKRVGYYEGRATGAVLVDHLSRLSKPKKDSAEQGKARMFLVTPELKMSVGTGGLAEDFVVKMTEWYKGRGEITDGTRTSGVKVIRSMCINWLAGTTREWMLDSLDRNAVEGGFLGRCLTAEGIYNLNKRYTRPLYPPDYEDVTQHLFDRVAELCETTGEFRMTKQARAIENEWYQTRPTPDDERLIPTWKRAHDMILKLAMILSLMDACDLLITSAHMRQAIQFSELAQRSVPSIIRAASVTRESRPLEFVRQIIRGKRVTTRIEVQRIASTQFTRNHVDEALRFLAEMQEIGRTKGSNGKEFLVWIGGTRGLNGTKRRTVKTVDDILTNVGNLS